VTTRTETATLAVLTASAVYVGPWAALFPQSFYDGFPGLNRTWVGGDGPYNEHLVRDVGALYLALAVAGALALIWHEPRVTTLVGAIWTVFSAPHLAYHVRHFGGLDTVDVVGNLVALAGTLVLAVVLLVCAVRRTEMAR
jgi:hypothetical protein